MFYLRGLEQSQSQDEEWVVLKHWTKQKPDDCWLEIGRSAQRKSLPINRMTWAFSFPFPHPLDGIGTDSEYRERAGENHHAGDC